MTEQTPPSQPLETERLSGGGGSTDVMEREETRKTDAGDSERYSHYVRKDKVTASAVSGGPVVALCGKVWVPGRDPNKFPVCPVCKEIYDGLREPQERLTLLAPTTLLMDELDPEVEEAFEAAANSAKSGCPVSKVLNAQITMEARLEG